MMGCFSIKYAIGIFRDQVKKVYFVTSRHKKKSLYGTFKLTSKNNLMLECDLIYRKTIPFHTYVICKRNLLGI